MSSFHSTATAVSRVITASTIAVAMAAPFAGIVADRFGRKRVIVPAAVLLAIPTLLAATASSIGLLMFWRFLQGVLTPGIFAVTIAYINEEWEEGVGSAMAAYVSGTVLGGFSGRMVAALVAAYSSWRWAFVVLAVLDLVCALVMAAWMPADHRFKGVPVRRGSTARAMLHHLRNPQLLATYAVGFCVLFTLVATFTYVNFYLAVPPFSLSTAALGLLFVVYLVGAVVTPIAGRAIDRLGHRFALTLAFSGGAAGIAITLVPRLPVVLLGLALCCTGVFIGQSSASSYIGTVATEARAAAVGLYVMFYYAGGSAGAELPGHLWSRGGWLGCVLLIASVQLMTILLGVLFWKRNESS
jgi:MFS transporter, YNFM family, putative membrane transport protein